MSSNPLTTPAAHISFLGARTTLLFAGLATALAGFLDAVGYAQLDHLYVSFMSGNSTHLGMTLAVGEWGQMIHAGYIIGIFVLGSFVGTVIFDAARKPLIALLVGEAVLCSIAIGLAIRGFPTAALTLTALMMGMQNVMHQNISGTDAGKGFITGSLFGLGQSLAHALRKPGEFAHAFVHGTSWLSFIFGVICGTLCFTHWGVVSSLVIAFFGLILMILISLKLTI
ncbi:YoaK family protein [Rhizobium tubonense]|uniref:DUF1275 family protein n=1 Tax=Rhizobium tubonense TaxID=484088 RepID=A0A2W4C4R0_9HYPH|nr:YoaK family protein [Rhizobium tubonense]PZM08041.1 DUF1275 family protein [Rhizobium tubonense]